MPIVFDFICFFFNDTATTEIYTLSLHDALPIYRLIGLRRVADGGPNRHSGRGPGYRGRGDIGAPVRSEEHTSELQSRLHLVCRLLLEKKKSEPARERLGRASGGACAEPPTAQPA